VPDDDGDVRTAIDVVRDDLVELGHVVSLLTYHQAAQGAGA